MIKFFLLLVIFTLTTLEASYYYDIGKKHFYNKEYEKAIEYFKQAIDDYSNIDMLIMWADSERALGRELYLIAAYERILNVNPDNFDIAMKLNNIYKKRDMEGEAVNTIDKFNYSDFENSYRAYITKFLHYDNAKIKKLHSSYYVDISSDHVEHIYDLNNSSYKQSVLGYPLKIKTNYNAEIDYSYLYDLNQNGLFFKTDTEIYANVKNDSSSMNTYSAKISVELGKKISDTILTLPISYKYKDVSKKYSFNILEIQPKVITLLDESHIYNASFVYSQKSYQDQQMSLLDSNTYGLSTNMRYILDTNSLNIGLSLLKTALKNTMKSNHPYSFVEKESYKIFFSNYIPLKNLKISFFMNFTVNDYKDIPINRQDKTLNTGAIFYTNPVNNAIFSYQIKFLSNDTNYEPLNYDKLIFKFGLAFNS